MDAPTISQSELEELECRAQAATPGPWEWEWESEPDGRRVDTLVSSDPSVVGGAILWARDGMHYQMPLRIDEADRQYIAAVSPDVALRLIAALQAENVKLREQITALHHQDEIRPDDRPEGLVKAVGEPTLTTAAPNHADPHTIRLQQVPQAEAGLDAMAADPALQRELLAIAREEAAPVLTLAQVERLNQIRGDQANRYNDGWSSPRSGPYHQAYQDIEFLLDLADPTYPARYRDEDDNDLSSATVPA